jgi:hypothetical protein
MADRIQVDHRGMSSTARLFVATLVTVLLLASATFAISGGSNLGGRWTSSPHSSIT